MLIGQVKQLLFLMLGIIFLVIRNFGFLCWITNMILLKTFLVDRWYNSPILYAGTVADLTFLQGFQCCYGAFWPYFPSYFIDQILLSYQFLSRNWPGSWDMCPGNLLPLLCLSFPQLELKHHLCGKMVSPYLYNHLYTSCTLESCLIS